MDDNDINEREGLLTTIRARRQWYLGVYFLQLLGWLALVVVNELHSANSADVLSQRILDNAVIMTFIGQGTLITTIFLMDVLFDGSRYIIKKGGELMGLLFNNFENKYVARGRKEGLERGLEQGLSQGREQGLSQGREQGLEQGEERADARWSAWIADNPELKKLIEEGKVVAPPGANNGKK